MRRFSLIALFALVCVGFLAAAPIGAVNNVTVDYISWVTAELDNLLGTGQPLLVNLAFNIVNGFGLTILVIVLIRWGIQSMGHHHVVINPAPLLAFLLVFAAINTMLYYYATPIPGVGVTFSDFPKVAARQISQFIDLSVYDTLQQRLSECGQKLQQPGNLLSFMEMFVYGEVTAHMMLLQGMLFLVLIYGYVGYAMTQLVGPLFVAMLLFPTLRDYFYSWLGTLLRFAFYRIAASALVFIWSSIALRFFDNLVAGDYSLAHFSALMVPFALINLSLIFFGLRLPAWVSDVCSGSAHSGHGGLTGMVSRFV